MVNNEIRPGGVGFLFTTPLDIDSYHDVTQRLNYGEGGKYVPNGLRLHIGGDLLEDANNPSGVGIVEVWANEGAARIFREGELAQAMSVIPSDARGKIEVVQFDVNKVLNGKRGPREGDTAFLFDDPTARTGDYTRIIDRVGRLPGGAVNHFGGQVVRRGTILGDVGPSGGVAGADIWQEPEMAQDYYQTVLFPMAAEYNIQPAPPRILRVRNVVRGHGVR